MDHKKCFQTNVKSKINRTANISSAFKSNLRAKTAVK